MMTTFKFADLDEKAKARARDEARDWNVEHDWWDYTYEDAIECGKLLGIEIESKDLSFSGFSQQGDGASFTGRYSSIPDVVKSITEHVPQDETLHAIARELTAFQVTMRLHTGDEMSANIKRSGRGCHSMTMYVDETYAVFGVGDGSDHTNERVKVVEDLMRCFADWIFEHLRDEYEYLTSDECIDEALAEHEFDEDGSMI